MSDEILRRHQLVWQKKPVLRLLYREWYQEIPCPATDFERPPWLKPPSDLLIPLPVEEPEHGFLLPDQLMSP